ncbi:MAG: D-alanine--D-alanine ligase [Bacteroidales bacterium]|nr:D-alanine--D-alanine ligase [Bacteroidales bacterium]
MTVGIAFDLRSWYLDHGFTMEETAEFDKEETIAALEFGLRQLGFDTDRIGNIFELTEKLAAGKRWDLVFNITEGLYGDGRESVVPALLDQYRIPYVFSGPAVMSLSLNKHLARAAVSAAGVPVSPGKMISHADEISDAGLTYPLFVKPVSEGTGKGITLKSKVASMAELRTQVIHILNNYNQPALVEEYLPGREFTVGITGSGKESTAIGGMEVICKDDLPYSVEVKENYQDYVVYKPIPDDLRDECYSVAVKAWNALMAVDGGRVDLKADRNGRICFIEANPLAGLNPVHSDLPILARMSGIEYQELLRMIINASMKRLGLHK